MVSYTVRVYLSFLDKFSNTLLLISSASRLTEGFESHVVFMTRFCINAFVSKWGHTDLSDVHRRGPDKNIYKKKGINFEIPGVDKSKGA